MSGYDEALLKRARALHDAPNVTMDGHNDLPWAHRLVTGYERGGAPEQRPGHSYVVKDLNDDPTLPFEDSSFDVVTNAVSIDYLTKLWPSVKKEDAS